MNGGEHVIQLKNVLACKDKWASIYSDFKQITFDYMLRTWSNISYWTFIP